jgi:hypothetical protein
LAARDMGVMTGTKMGGVEDGKTKQDLTPGGHMGPPLHRQGG